MVYESDTHHAHPSKDARYPSRINFMPPETLEQALIALAEIAKAPFNLISSPSELVPLVVVAMRLASQPHFQDRKVLACLGDGRDCIALKLDNETCLKLYKGGPALVRDHGPEIDAPLIAKGSLTISQEPYAGRYEFVQQALGDTDSISDEAFKAFLKKLTARGYSLTAELRPRRKDQVAWFEIDGQRQLRLIDSNALEGI